MFTHSIFAKPRWWPKNHRLSPLLTNFGKKSLSLHRRWFKSLFIYFFALIFFTLTLATIFVSASFLPKVSKVKERGWKLNFRLWVGKNWQGSAKLSPLPLSPPPSEFCNDENYSIIRSAMDALRYSKKISLLAVAILFLFTFFQFDFGCTSYIDTICSMFMMHTVTKQEGWLLVSANGLMTLTLLLWGGWNGGGGDSERAELTREEKSWPLAQQGFCVFI